jgi:hypothetical protein
MRYKLKKGKFGCYFYDSEMDIDLSLEMVLNRLNDSRIALDKLRVKYNRLNVVYLLKERELKETKKKLTWNDIE